MTAAHCVTREFFFTAARRLLRIRARRHPDGCQERAGHRAAVSWPFCWLLSSKAFVDYTSSGLEYPLSYLLLALFYVRFFEISDRPLTTERPAAFRSAGGAGIRQSHRQRRAVCRTAGLAGAAGPSGRRDERSAPLVIAFAAPVARLAAVRDAVLRLPSAEHVLRKSRHRHPASAALPPGLRLPAQQLRRTIRSRSAPSASPACWRCGSTMPLRTAMASSLLYVAYTISVGGDFMSGRFFAMPFLVAVMAHVARAAESANTSGPPAAALLALQPVHADRAGEDDRRATTPPGPGDRRTASRTSAATTTRSPTCSATVRFTSSPITPGFAKASASATARTR